MKNIVPYVSHAVGVLAYYFLFQDSSAYREWRLGKSPTLADVLEEFGSSHPDAARLLYALPRLRPRMYNIASAPGNQEGQVQLAVAELLYPVEGMMMYRFLLRGRARVRAPLTPAIFHLPTYFDQLYFPESVFTMLYLLRISTGEK